jgi:hypothetical protein
MTHVMLDLETFGSSAGCGLISIGAVEFSFQTGRLGKEFYSIVSHQSCRNHGLRDDAQTLDWWEKQSEEAKAAYRESNSPNAPELPKVLKDFELYLHGMNEAKKIRMWGNGSDFDNNVLAAAYQAASMAYPWRFWNNRCYRTLRSMYHGPITLERVGTHHNALDDAKTQAAHAIKIFSLLNLKEGS